MTGKKNDSYSATKADSPFAGRRHDRRPVPSGNLLCVQHGELLRRWCDYATERFDGLRVPKAGGQWCDRQSLDADEKQRDRKRKGAQVASRSATRIKNNRNNDENLYRCACISGRRARTFETIRIEPRRRSATSDCILICAKPREINFPSSFSSSSPFLLMFLLWRCGRGGGGSGKRAPCARRRARDGASRAYACA